uniref:BD-FAE-like domain-containing protein n=1 Tax=Grammatophora oceanica TaxID=210454 RepID=A0A7S1YET3_9STRA|mmetsp:Transcript_43252/g.64122  ORF Transcript_43252/g.64122 Transcript_43252/m.64122 type:complete len:461 (+) Transcript_43252:39-1421(+)
MNMRVVALLHALQIVGFVLVQEQVAAASSLRRSTRHQEIQNTDEEVQATDRKLNSQYACGCVTCTDDVLDTMARGSDGKSYSCRGRIDWLISSKKLSEEDACRRVAGDEFGIGKGPCGPACDPDQCWAVEPTSPCGCESCTANVLSRMGTDMSGTFSCGARISWLMRNGKSERDACSVVARNDFPNTCGQCDPGRCAPLRDGGGTVVYTTKSNIYYLDGLDGSVSSSQKERSKLDLYYPKGATNFATIVYFHGGGLYQGSKDIPNALKEQGVAVVAPNYRLHPQNKFPTYADDAANAVAWVFRNIHKYGGSNQKIFVAGWSAGGYLASLVGMDKRYLGAHNIDANRIAGLIPVSGHTYTHWTVRNEMGISYTSIPNEPCSSRLKDSAPYCFARGDAPPILLMTGDRSLELKYRWQENSNFMQRLKERGHRDVTLKEFKGKGHGIINTSAGPMLEFVRARS